MNRARTNRRRLWLLALVAAVFGADASLEAQQAGGRFRVFVPNLTPQEGARARFGEDVADELRDRIGELNTHAPVEEREVRAQLRKFRLREDDLDCIKSRQLAVQMGAELVMCGSYSRDNQVEAEFISARSGETFRVPAFAARDAKQAAAHIFQSFEAYINQLRVTQFCMEYLNSSQWQNANETCSQALAQNPESQQALYGKARALMELDSLETAQQLIQKLLEINPVHQDGLLAAGFIATKLNQTEVARNYYRQYLEMNPGSAQVRLQVALDLAKAGDPEGALRVAQEGLAQDSANASLLEYAGHFALAAGQEAQETGANGEPGTSAQAFYEQALSYYQRVFEQKGNQSEPLMLRNMVATLSALDRPREAADLAGRIIAVKRDDASLWSVYADALAKANRLDEASAALDTVLTLDPQYANVFARKGTWLVQAGQLAGAREAFTQAIQRQEATADDIARNVFSVGYNTKYKNNQHDAALEYFALARDLATTPHTRAMASFWSGWIWYQRGIRTQEPSTAASARQALPMFQRALEFFQQSGPYANQEPSVNLPNVINATNQYIEIQDALIRRGR